MDNKKETAVNVEKGQKQGVIEKKKYTLLRVEDKKSWSGDKIDFITWKQDGTFKGVTSVPTVGASFALDLVQGVSSTCVTTEIEKIIESTNKTLKFKTKKDTYELTIG